MSHETVKPPAGRPPPRPRNQSSNATRTLARWMFHSHLWVGIVVTGVVLLISITGILLNNKRPLGLMPDVAHEATGPFESALPLAELVRLADAAVAPEVAAAGVDRMDIRPGDGLAKVRYDDRRVMEVTLDINTGAVLQVGERNDVFLEKLHSGEIFGDGWTLLSDLAAIGLVLLIVSGYWIWLFPKSRI